MQRSASRPDMVASAPAGKETEHLMTRYQQADAAAATALVDLLSLQLFRSFASQMPSRTIPEATSHLSRELGADVLPEPPAQRDQTNYLPPFDELVAGLPESQREVLVMLKVNGLSIEEFARTTTSTPGAVSRRPTMNGCATY